MKKQKNKQIKGGCFLVARQIFTSEVMSWPPHWFKLWIWLIGKANHKTIRKDGFVYHRGTVLTTYKEMQKVISYQIGWQKKKFSKDVIRKFYVTLRRTQMATTRKTTRGVVVTIRNYDLFQGLKNYEKTPTKTPTKTTSRHQTSTRINKNEKNEKNDHNKRRHGTKKNSLGKIKKVSPQNPSLRHEEIFDHYLKESGEKRTRLTSERKAKIKARLKTFTSEQIKEAITKCFQDKFYSGNNDRGWKATIDWIFKNDENLGKIFLLKPRVVIFEPEYKDDTPNM